MQWKAIFKGFLYDTFGAIATAGLLICTLSGIALAIPYDVVNPYESISRFIINNPTAAFFRNFHYWSGQFFLVFTIIHVIDHLYRNTESRVRPNVWLRLTLSLIAVFFVMLSGFILKGDADSLQARRILDALIRDIPLMGDFLSYVMLGSEESFQLLYVHHVATATVFIFIVVYEHARYIWTKARTTVITTLIIVVLSVFFQAPLHDNIDTVVKGPWYFVGLQEILHWMSQAGWALLIVVALLGVIYFIPKVNLQTAALLKRVLLIALVIYSALTVTGYFFRGENWQWEPEYAKEAYNPFEVQRIPLTLSEYHGNEIPEIRGRAEACLVCHEDMNGFTDSHNPQGIGCASCHLGDPFTLDKKVAHEKMVTIPGNLSVADKTCGTAECHPDITNRIDKNIMTTNSGMITVDRFVFNEEVDLSALAHIQNLSHSAADQHFRNLCANCHLGNEKRELGVIDQMTRGGGCNACHLNYDKKAEQELQKYLQQDTDTMLTHFHPEVSLNVSDKHCFGCHSRSGRISTNYEGWHETQLEKEEIEESDTNKYRVLQDGRVFKYVEADVHHQLGMECIDCHTSYELMGDGDLYAHKEQQQKVSCGDCHFNGEPKTKSFEELTAEEQKIINLRTHLSKDKKYLVSNEAGQALTNTWYDGDSVYMKGKNTAKSFTPSSPDEICTRGDAHSDITCSACHTSWAPQCIGCHNEFDEEVEKGFDLLAYEETKGSWVEYIGRFLADPPTLGIDEHDTGRTVTSFAPGMVLSIDKSTWTEDEDKEMIHHRLFAPSSPHTISTKGRDCKSCHNSSLALGYGRGELKYETDGRWGKWKFNPRFSDNEYDGLPEDAWTGFMEGRNDVSATRKDMRPFNTKEQESILLVGSCLECHNQDSQMMRSSLDNFQSLLDERSEKCVLPDFYYK